MRKKSAEITPEEEIIYVSRTELKRDAKELQILSLELANLNVKQRQQLPLNEEIDAALRLADKIKGKHDAFNRNIRFLARLLATIDLDAVKVGLDKINNKHSQELLKVSRLEDIRDSLITEGDEKIEQLLAEYQDFDRQRMRQLVRQAAKEVKLEKPGKSFRELFKYLKEHVVL